MRSFAFGWREGSTLIFSLSSDEVEEKDGECRHHKEQPCQGKLGPRQLGKAETIERFQCVKEHLDNSVG